MAQAEMHIASLGIPRNAFEVIVRAPMKLLADLKGEDIPARGGVAIDRIVLSEHRECSLGANARTTIGNTLGFITAKHCVHSTYNGTCFGCQVTQPWQGFPYSADGDVFLDVGLHFPPACPSKYTLGCRYSEAVFVRWYNTANARFGTIAQPKSTKNWAGQYDIIGTYWIRSAPTTLLDGLQLYKVGWKTGETVSASTNHSTCIEVNGGHVGFLCMGETNQIPSDGGDSGGPVFAKTSQVGANYVALYGFVMSEPTVNPGNVLYWSPLSGVHQDLGTVFTYY